MLSRNTSDTGLRIRNSIEAHNLNISRAVFCGGESPYKYVKAFGVDLFLSSSKDDVKMAIENGVPSARIIPSKMKKSVKSDELLRIAFDGDSVIFSDESEKIYAEEGLKAFMDNERKKKSMLKAGPFKSFLVELNKLQSELINECPIRTALVTARSAPSDKRVIKTLREWGVRIDESLFLGGMSKQEFLKSFQADIFFDDQETNIIEASKTTASGHVPSVLKIGNKMDLVCFDMEGTLTPEIWEQVAVDSGLEELNKTTRDIPSYSDLMDYRLEVMAKHNIKLADVMTAATKLDLLDGALDFLNEVRKNFQIVILSDTFHEIASPLMEKMGHPLLLCHTLTVDAEDNIVSLEKNLIDEYIKNNPSEVVMVMGSSYESNKSALFLMHHPRDILKNPTLKRESWEILKKVKQCLK